MTEKKNGFTLIELLIVLVAWSILILLVIPFDHNFLDQQQEEQFFKMFAYDVLYVQSISTTTKDYVRMNVQKEKYFIRIGNTKDKVIERKVPKGWNIDYRTLSIISFDQSGRMNTPGSLLIYTNDTTYKITFPFGKGRFHVVEQ